MSSNRTTTTETEADLEARVRAAIKVAFPWLPDGAIKHQIKFSFKFGRQTLVAENGKSRADARLDILLEKDGKPLAVMELKRPGIKLTADDGAQGLSYARLVQPPAPVVVVTNGTDVRILETSTGNSNNADVSLYHHLVCRLTRLV
ncbi:MULTISPECIES: type I restriction enzyme HsdR N-terminal domain-containing protein [Enterobacteriaceae]|uniref:type I restriction enzyme HsdR N-terminal domain-containing protein n=1 Tax=Enterobacteriaceae TaxID=543 RepID=UPI00216A0E70|nr:MULTISPECIES: type I restriction enzyme HsdR N-terminal domain-containing protein [Enterobacteriaceae]HBR7615457.1 type I restriction enzyme HsdR N-terminal domain-containing protein [Klebsiella pneumoniae]HCT2636839.1 type I restriction enzyme HsdR N-terminal domain-containing protein [Enterobacter roggenkampii]MCS4378644.1 type I restriction enzyme HsdR N-terminal domain-containing protein [Klebsiella quasipneumoniae subsp. similipneumoniae]MCS4421651.1 type I restriction enzyme HsdR N-ter